MDAADEMSDSDLSEPDVASEISQHENDLVRRDDGHGAIDHGGHAGDEDSPSVRHYAPRG